MGDTARLDPFTVEFWERRIEQLKSQKRKLEMKLTNFFTEQADCKGRKKRFKKVSLERKIKHPEIWKKFVGQEGLEDAKKHAREIDSVVRIIKFMEKRKKCISLAAKRSISMEAAQNLVEQPAGECAEEYKRVQDLNDHCPQDPATVATVGDPDDKMKLINVARSIVNVSYLIEIQDLEDLDGCCTGVIVDWDMDNKTAKILTCDCFRYGIDNSSNCKQGTLLDIPTQIPHFCLSPLKYGDEVFALGRDKDLSLAVCRGTVMQEQCFFTLRQGYLFVGYELPECGTGGPVVDHHGNVVGLSIPCIEGISVILPISTALSCLKMWTEFGRIARPLLGMCFRNVEVRDGVSGDIRFDGLVVAEVKYNSAAWEHGIRRGNVIVSFDEKSPKPLPELEVQDAPDVKRSITLHVPFSDVANVRFSRLL